MTTLDQLSPRQTARVETISGDPALTQRLMDLGLFEGETVTLVAFAPLGDPLEIQVGYTRLSLRKSEAAAIAVTLLS